MQSVHFSEHMLARRRRRRRGVDVTAHIGANPNELLEDGSNVALRNWGLLTPGSDPADTMFADTPPPIIVNIFISLFIILFNLVENVSFFLWLLCLFIIYKKTNFCLFIEKK